MNVVIKLLEEIKYDAQYIRSHTLQPRWWKVGKIFVLVGFLVGYGYIFGLAKTLVFLAVFLMMSLVVHMVYRVKTGRFTRSWLDFVVVEEDNEVRAKSIGKFYYGAVAFNAISALAISQMAL